MIGWFSTRLWQFAIAGFLLEDAGMVDREEFAVLVLDEEAFNDGLASLLISRLGLISLVAFVRIIKYLLDLLEGGVGLSGKDVIKVDSRVDCLAMGVEPSVR